MIPYLLAAVGGYLIGQSQKKDVPQMAKGGRILVGRFDENQLRNGEDKKAIEKKMKETGLKYIDSRIIKKNGKPHIMEVYLYADGGMMAKGGFVVKAWQTKNDYENGNAQEVGKFQNIQDAHLLVDDYLSPNKFEWYAAEIYDANDGETLYHSEDDGYTEMADGGMMARGGKVKKKWIQDALGGDTGSLRRTAKRKGLLRGDENLSMTDLKKLQKMGGTTAKRAHLAETLRNFADGGMTDLEKYHNENGSYITEMELDEFFEKSVDGYKKEDFYNVAEKMGYEYDEDSDQYYLLKMAKGGKIIN